MSFPFNPDDVMLFEETLTEEERLIMESARDYAQSKLEPRALEGNQDEIFHDEIPGEMAELGFFGATLPPEYGGSGISYTGYGLIARELERVDSGYRSMASVQSSLVMYPIYRFGTEEQKERFLPGLASGELIGCFGLTEPDHGSDPGSMETTAVRTSGVIVVSEDRSNIIESSLPMKKSLLGTTIDAYERNAPLVDARVRVSEALSRAGSPGTNG